MSQENTPLLLTDKVNNVEVTIYLFDANGDKINQCVGGAATYGSTVKSNVAKYFAKMKSQIARGLIPANLSKAELVLSTYDYTTMTRREYRTTVTL